MNDDEKALLTTIGANLTDDAPRLAYADWLIAQGRAWGELIKLSITLPTLPDKEQAKAGKRMASLLRSEWKDGLGPATAFVTKSPAMFRRGFPAYASALATPFFKCAEEAALRTPGATFHLTDVKSKQLPALAQLQLTWADGTLALTKPTDRDLAVLAQSPVLRAFGELRVESGGVGPAGLEALAGSGAAGAIRSLRIDDWNDLSPIFATPHLGGLTSLTAYTKSLKAGLRGNVRRLGLLQIGGLDDLDDEDAGLLAATAWRETLNGLSLTRGVKATGTPSRLSTKALVEMVAGLPKLTSLWMYEFGLAPETVKELEALLASRRGRFYC